MNLEWIVNLKSNIQQQLAGAANAFQKTDTAAKSFQKTTSTLPNNLENIRKKVEDLKVIRDLTTDVRELAKANREIASLERNAGRLSTTGTQNRLQGLLSNSSIPGVSGLAGLATPAGAAAAGVAVVGAALAQGTKNALAFDAGMAKANTTLGLTKPELAKVSGEVANLAALSGIENALGQVPEAFNQIVSGVNDTALSMDILRNSLKGAEAAQTDLRVVSDAVVNTMNSVGAANTNAKEIMDTLFGAVKVGKGEFADFANYLPRVIPLSNNLGLSFKETAGAFAFFTSQGLKAEQTSTVLENVFKAFSDNKRQAAFKAFGIQLFDQKGNLRGLVDISTQLKNKLDGLTNQDRVRILDSLGLDQEATLGASGFVQNLDKLKDSIEQTRNAASLGIGLDGAFEKGKNVQSEYNKAMNQFQELLRSIGAELLPAVNFGLQSINNSLQGMRIGFDLLKVANKKIGEFGQTGLGKTIKYIAAPGTILTDLMGGGKKEATPAGVPSLLKRPSERDADYGKVLGLALNSSTTLGLQKKSFDPIVVDLAKKTKADPFATNYLKNLDRKEKEKSEKVTGGGSRPVNIQIKMDQLGVTGGLTIQSTTVTEGINEVETMLKQMFLRVVNSANQIALG